jgi:hypothetical protein
MPFKQQRVGVRPFIDSKYALVAVVDAIHRPSIRLSARTTLANLAE